MYSMIHN